jgi:hypothetical protein
MIALFHTMGITEHDEIMDEMGIKEKEHEIFFLSKIKTHPWLPTFEKLFKWGASKSYNDVEIPD